MLSAGSTLNKRAVLVGRSGGLFRARAFYVLYKMWRGGWW